MSIIIPNVEAFPTGIAPKLNVNHVAYNQHIRLAAVATGSGAINLVNGKSGIVAGAVTSVATINGFGVGVAAVTGGGSISHPAIAPSEPIGAVTEAVIFVYAPSSVAGFIIGPYAGTSPAALSISAAGAIVLTVNGATITWSPVLPTLITGHSYFVGVTANNGASPKQHIVLVDLTTGAVTQAVATNSQFLSGATSANYNGLSFTSSVGFNTRINAQYLNITGAAVMAPKQLLEWATQDPWGIWYDRSTQNVMQMAVQTAAPSGATLALAATDAHDTASFNITVPSTVSLAAVDAHDTASVSLSIPATVSLSATDAHDTASFNVVEPQIIQWIQGGASVTNVASSNTTVTLAPITSGNMIIISAVSHCISGTPTIAISDDKGTVYTTVNNTITTNAGSVKGYFGYALNVTTGPSVFKVTVGTITVPGIVVDEFSGVLSASPFDGANTFGSASLLTPGQDAIVSGPITPTANGDLIYGGIIDGIGLGGNTASGTGFARLSGVTGTNASLFSEWKIQTPSASIQATATPTNSSDWLASVMAFKAKQYNPFGMSARDAHDIASFAVNAVATSSISLHLAANDAVDLAVFNTNVSNKLHLSATDAHDTASFAANVSNKFVLSTTDAHDTASFATNVSNKLHFSASDAKDIAAFQANVSNKLHFSATDAHDTASFALNGSTSLHLAANDAHDTASFQANVSNKFVFSATDAHDTASFAANVSNRLHFAALDAKDTASFALNAVAAFVTLNLSATDAHDVASFNTNVSNKLHLSGTDAHDTASFNASVSNKFTLSATDAKDTASFATTGNLPVLLGSLELTTAHTAITITSAAAVPIGTPIICFIYDSNIPITGVGQNVTDSKGNVYTSLANAIASPNDAQVFGTVTTVALTTSDTITYTSSGGSPTTLIMTAVSCPGYSAIDTAYTNASTSTATTYSITGATTAVAAHELNFGFLVTNGFNAATGWTLIPTASSTTYYVAYNFNPTTSPLTFNGTQHASGKSEQVIVALVPNVVGINLALNTNDATDTASFSLTAENKLVLSTTDAHDTASFSANVSGISLHLSATDAHDAASFNVSVSNKLHMSAQDAKDAASMAINVSNKLHLSAVDAHDTAAFSANVSNKLHMAAVDAHDIAAFSTQVSNHLALSATDAHDTFSGSVNVSNKLILAAADAKDHASFNVVAENKFALAAHDAVDQAQFTIESDNKLVLSATDAVDSAIFSVSVSNKFHLSASDAHDHASFAVTLANKLHLSSTDARDTAHFELAETTIRLEMTVNDATDRIKFKTNTTIINPTILDETITYKANTIARILYWARIDKERKARDRFR